MRIRSCRDARGFSDSPSSEPCCARAALVLTVLVLALVAGCGESGPTGTAGGNGSGDDGTDGAGGSGGGEEAASVHPLAGELPIEERSFRIGTGGLVPRNHPDPSGEDWTALFDSLAGYGELYVVQSGWDVNPSDGVPAALRTGIEQAREQGLVPFPALGFELDFASQEEAATYFEEHGSAFRETAVAVAEEYAPQYLGLGVEVNRLFEQSEDGFGDYLSVYETAYEEVKAASPETRVYVTFQYDYMRGGGAVTGREHEPHFELVDRFGEALDLVGISVYPFFDADRPDQIPETYLSELTDRTDLPILVSETGWPSREAAGIPGSPDAQIDYLMRLLELTTGEAVVGVAWLFPHDTDFSSGDELFDYISLKENDGTAKEVYPYWQALRSLELIDR